MSAPITLIEEQSSLRDALSHILNSRGKQVDALAERPDDSWQPQKGAIVVVDWGLVDEDLIAKWTEQDQAQVIVTALVIEKAQALALLRHGIWSLHRKPLNVRDFLEDLGEAESAPQSGGSPHHTVARPGATAGSDGGKRPALHLVGPSDVAEELRDRLKPESVKSAPPWVAVHGPPGTRKDTLARLWHAVRFDGEGEFVARDCRALGAVGIEAEVVSVDGNPGELLQPGETSRTVYLECVEALPEGVQQRIARVLARDEGNLCVVLGLDGDLESHFDAGRLSSGLYSRMSLSTVETFALVDRREDLVEMAKVLIEAPRDGFPVAKGIREGAVALLTQYKWPGNIREMEHVILHARHLAAGDFIEAEHLAGLLD